jgi:UTP:GlnB (protein PII) uridylyltransferase
MVESTIMTALRSYVKALGSCGIHASRLVLFGSFARDDAHEFSDIDLIVIAPEFNGPRGRTLAEKTWRATISADSRIEQIPCGQRQWQTNQSRPILAIARRERIVITA